MKPHFTLNYATTTTFCAWAYVTHLYPASLAPNTIRVIKAIIYLHGGWKVTRPSILSVELQMRRGGVHESHHGISHRHQPRPTPAHHQWGRAY